MERQIKTRLRTGTINILIKHRTSLHNILIYFYIKMCLLFNVLLKTDFGSYKMKLNIEPDGSVYYGMFMFFSSCFSYYVSTEWKAVDEDMRYIADSSSESMLYSSNLVFPFLVVTALEHNLTITLIIL